MIPPKINDLMDSYLGASPRTKKNYESFNRLFWDFVKKDDPAKVTLEDIIAFLNDGLVNKKWKPSTVEQYSTLCQLFIGEFHDETFRKKLRKQLKKLPKSQSRAALYEGIYVPPEKIDDFIAHALDEEWAVFYTMILKWGLRLSEALTIAPANIDVAKNRIIVRGKGLGGMGKVRQVLVELPTITRVLIFAGCSQEQIRGEKPIRDTAPIIKTIKERMAEYQWKSTAKKIGLKHWKQLTPHDGRHSFAINFLIKRKKEGMAALVLLKNQLGHTNIQTTMIYLDIAGGEAQDVFDAGLT